jgi:hypothetical protein
MSSLQDTTDASVPAQRTAPEVGQHRETAGTHREPRWSSRRRLGFGAAAACLALVAVVVGVVVAQRSSRSSDAGAGPVGPNTPIALPADVLGVPAVAQGDPAQTPLWKQRSSAASKGSAVQGRTYQKPGQQAWTRVVAARADLTGKLELAWAADKGQKVGDVSCTNNTMITGTATARRRPTLMLCWRTSATLSVYALVVDPKATTSPSTGAAASVVDQVWAGASHPA